MADDAAVIPESPCPGCGYHADRSTPVLDEDCTPKPGDISMCLGCGAVNRFADDLTICAMSEAEFRSLPPDTQAVIEGAKQAYAKAFPNGLPR